MWPGLRPTSKPSDILIHPAIWPQQIWAENWGLCPFGGKGDGSLSNAVWSGGQADAYLHAKFHLDPSSRLATTDMGRKLRGGLCPFFGKVELGPHLTQCGLGRGLPAYQLAS